jgi:putative tricarboxylic transport membrane protein
MKKSLSLVLMLTLVFGAVVMIGGVVLAESAQYPNNDIEFVVPSSAGGGSDLNARTIAELANKYDLSPENFMVVNKPGGSGAVAFTHVFNKSGNPNTLMVLHSGQVMSALVNDSPVKADMLTFIATVALDELTLCVNTDGSYENIESVIEAATENPGSIRIGGSQRGNGDHLAFEMFNKYTEGEYSYVQFNGSGDVMSSLLGGHIDVGIFNPREAIGQITADRVEPIAVFASERIPGEFSEAPNFIELGYEEIELREIRAIAGPPNMPEEAISFYEDMLEEITQTEEWKEDYIANNYMTNYYLDSEESEEFFDGQIKLYSEMFRKVGLID